LSGSLALPTHASQRCFRSLLEALANPGQVVTLEEPEAVAAGAAVIPLALADIDTPVAIVGNEILASEVSEATRAPLVPVAEARLVALLRPAPQLVGQCQTGSAEAPELGAKVGLACSRLVDGAPDKPAPDEPAPDEPAPDGPAPQPAAVPSVMLVLEGPGVEGARNVLVEGIGQDVFETISMANRHFPAGLDAWLVDTEGHVVGLPRSTRIEVR
jgi:alpha-D-ribose 1-methylphosphonate 5-triphosphate synthase subunit PhnH